MPKPSITMKKPLQAFENSREMKKAWAADECFTLNLENTRLQLVFSHVF